MSAALGFPLFVEIKSCVSTKISKFLHCCFKIIPEEMIIASSRISKLGDLELIRGKVVVRQNNGIPIEILDNLFDAYLNQDPPIGYVGVLSPKDPRRNSRDVLVVDLDTDMSELVKTLEGNIDEPSQQWDPEIQGAFIKTGSRRPPKQHSTFDNSFLKKKWASMEYPHKDVALRVYSSIAELSSESIRFDAKGTLLEPLPHEDGTTSTTEAMTYTLAPLILGSCLNRRPLTADYSPGEIRTLNTLKMLQEKDCKASGFTVEAIIKETEIAQSTQYRLINALEEKGAIKVAYGEKFVRLYRVNPGVFEEFSDLSYPTLDESQQETRTPEPEATPSDAESTLTTEAELERSDVSPQLSEVPGDPQQEKEIELPDESDKAIEEKNDNLDDNVPGSPTGDIDANISEVSELPTNKEAQVSEGVDSSPPTKKRGRPPKNEHTDNPSKVKSKATTNPESNLTPPEEKTSEDTEEVISTMPLAEEITPATPASDESLESATQETLDVDPSYQAGGAIAS
jgi:DNA-binding MarR family transcriptional regulator